jgi:hypothetical protein
MDSNIRALAAPILGNKNFNNTQPSSKSAIDSLKDVSQIYVNTLDRVGSQKGNEFDESRVQHRSNNSQNDESSTLSKLNLQTFVTPVNRLSQLDNSVLKENNNNNRNSLKQDNNNQQMYKQQPIYENVAQDNTIINSVILQNRAKGLVNTASSQSTQDNEDEEEEVEPQSSYGIGHLVKATEPNKQFGKFENFVFIKSLKDLNCCKN